MKVGIVILNYKNWEDTIECVESIFNQTLQSFEIVIVDNNSKNESFNEFKKRYSNISNIHLIRAKKNYGFAKGNNIGVKYCKNVLNIYNVFVCNNDVVFTDKEYLSKLTQYSVENNIGAIGTRIKGSDGINQNPISIKTDFYTLVKHFIEPILISIGLSSILGLGHKIVQLLKNKKGKVNSPTPIKESNSQGLFFLHGSAIYFTENYLKLADGFYPETFLYYEENILAIVFEKLGLKMKYLDSIEIYHKEDQSMNLTFQNVSKSKRKLQRKSIMVAMKARVKSAQGIIKKFESQQYRYSLINNRMEHE